jgi:hypothetical protein
MTKTTQGKGFMKGRTSGFYYLLEPQIAGFAGSAAGTDPCIIRRPRTVEGDIKCAAG